MKKTLITPACSAFPPPFRAVLEGAAIYDSSSSRDARVFYIKKGPGYFLKTAPSGTLVEEASLTRFYHSKGLGPQVLDFVQEKQQDWLLTQKLAGEDCLHSQYIQDPKRLSALTGELLRALHETSWAGCPIDRTKVYIDTARQNYHTGNYNKSLFPDNWGYSTPEEAFQVVQEAAPSLRSDTLLHGDYCLPNIILNDWNLSGFIDLGRGGIGDRHMDLFWGIWSLGFNLKTDAYTDRFLDAYGRDRIDQSILDTIGAFAVFV